jgi:hypothetical protein
MKFNARIAGKVDRRPVNGVDHDVIANVCLGQCAWAYQARAMAGQTNLAVLFDERDVKTGARNIARDPGPSRACANDQYVIRQWHAPESTLRRGTAAS